jgi:hypothetical protein
MGAHDFRWFKTVIEEQLDRETNMTRDRLMSLSGWGLILGPLALSLGLGEPVQYRSLLNNLVDAPSEPASLMTLQFVTETARLIR